MLNVRHGLLLVTVSALSLAAAPVAGAHVQDVSPQWAASHATATPTHGAAVAAASRDTFVRTDSKAPPQLLNHPRVKAAATSGNLGWLALGGLLLMGGIVGLAVVLAERGATGVKIKSRSRQRPIVH
jgi:hypothetical protein